MNDTMIPFLNEGLNVYAEARTTITFFENEISKLLSAAVGQRKQWPFLETHEISKPQSDTSIGQGGYWVEMSIKGLSHRKEEVKIDCGIWWNAPENDNPIIIYGNYTDNSKNVSLVSRTKQGVDSFNAWNRTYLYLPLSKTTDISDSLNRVLDALLEQLK